MKKILEKCTRDDFNYISNTLDSYLSFTNDKRRKELLEAYEENPLLHSELVALVDSQIKYFGSSDFAYAKRSLINGDGSISAEEIIEDVCKKLKINIKIGGSIESTLEKLVMAVVEKELLSKSPEDLSKAFKDMGVGEIDSDDILSHLKKNGKVAILPIIFQILGPKTALGIVETIIVSIIANIIGREAAKQLVKEMLKRNPWINSLGPFLWVASGLWIVFDLQGPAYRKTVPLCLYLGIVALRDGEEVI